MKLKQASAGTCPKCKFDMDLYAAGKKKILMTGTQESCECEICREMCEWPCMGTPAEIQEIISAGMAFPNLLDASGMNHPILDFECVKPRRVEGRCVYHENGKCVLHPLGLKPMEGREALHDVKPKMALYRKIERSWKTKKGRALVERIVNETSN